MNKLMSSWFVKENDSTNQGLGFKPEIEHAATLKLLWRHCSLWEISLCSCEWRAGYLI